MVLKTYVTQILRGYESEHLDVGVRYLYNRHPSECLLLTEKICQGILDNTINKLNNRHLVEYAVYVIHHLSTDPPGGHITDNNYNYNAHHQREAGDVKVKYCPRCCIPGRQNQFDNPNSQHDRD